MSFKIIGGGSSLDNVVNDVNQNIREMMNREVTEIFKDETGTRRVLLGKGPLGYGLYVSPEGVDVYEADVDDLIFSSSRKLFHIVGERTLSLSMVLNTSNFASVSVAHGLSYKPAHESYITVDPVLAALGGGTDNGPNPFVVNYISGTSIVTQGVGQVTVNATNIIFTVYMAGTGSATLNFSAKVYLLQKSSE